MVTIGECADDSSESEDEKSMPAALLRSDSIGSASISSANDGNNKSQIPRLCVSPSCDIV